MATEEHVALLKKSVLEWNQWREKRPDVTPDLREADLQEANFERARLDYANLRNANLTGADLTGADLTGADLQKVKNLTCEQISSVKSLDKETKFPDYSEVKITGENQWTCKEVKNDVFLFTPQSRKL